MQSLSSPQWINTSKYWVVTGANILKRKAIRHYVPPDKKNTILLIGLPNKTTLNKTSGSIFQLQEAQRTEEYIVLHCEHTVHETQTSETIGQRAHFLQ